MNIYQKYPEISKMKLAMLIGRVSKYYDEGKSPEYMAKEIKIPIEMVNDFIEIKKGAIENSKKLNNKD